MAARVLSHLRATSTAQRGEPVATATDQPAESRLTAREREVLDLIAQGARDREIAGHLGLTENTVKKHVKNLLHKFGARNRVEAVARLRNQRT